MQEDEVTIRTVPIRIWHFFLLTTLVALLAAWWQWCNYLKYSGAAQDLRTELDPFWRLFWSMLQGCNLTALVVLQTNSNKTGRLLHHPGHWIILLSALPIPLLIAIHTLQSVGHFMLEVEPGHNFVTRFPYLLYGLIAAAVAVAWSIGFKRMRGTYSGVWRSVFFLEMCASVSYSLTYASYLIGTRSPFRLVGIVFDLLAVLLMLVAMFVDYRTATQRDWLHRVAIAMSWASLIIQSALLFAASTS